MQSFQECLDIASLMVGFEKPWCIAGGWAIDLFLGTRTREHSDIEILVSREDQLHVKKYLSGYSFWKVKDGHIEQWQHDEWLELPIHEVQAHDVNNNSMEILLNEKDTVDWIFRRDSRIRRPFAEVILHGPGIPSLNPA